MIFVDNPVHLWRGMRWCHMVAIDLDTLHLFAADIGMKRDWFQCPPDASYPHYDLNEKRRAIAISKGAIVANKYTIIYAAKRLLLELNPSEILLKNVHTFRSQHQKNIHPILLQ